tara:strand:- start:900 stop:1007 length:108 start_codon:yes stop_codon:yes gene_type:complete
MKGLFGEKRLARNPGANQLMALVEKADFGIGKFIF